jgi:hypothetical protein
MRIRLKTCLLIFPLIAGLWRTECRADIPAAFADIGYGARPVGMGGAYVALASDPYALLFNPACLPDVRGWQVSTMYAKQFGIIPYTLASMAGGLGSRHGAGITVLTSGDEVLRETTILAAYGWKSGNPGNPLHHFALGLTLKARMSSFGNNADGGELRIRGSASGYGLDLGMCWKIDPRWTFGLLLRDAWNRMNYVNQTLAKRYGESVPAALILGTAYTPRSNLVFVLDVDKGLYRDVQDKFSTGMEWMLFKTLFFRTGLSQSLEGDPNRKLNFGLGLQHFRKNLGVRFDFAYQLHFLANTPRVSISLWL